MLGRPRSNGNKVLGDQIYIAALVESASKTPIGKTWVLDRSQVIADLGITDVAFEEIQRQIEARMTGNWDRATGTGRKMYVYLRFG